MEQYAQTAPESSELSLFELQVDHELSNTFRNMGKWAKLVAIFGFIMTGLILLIALLIGKALSSIPQFSIVAYSGGGALTTVYIVIAALFFFPALFAFNFSRKLQYALNHNDQQGLNDAFTSIKLRLKFVGIVYIVVFSLWVLIILLSIIF
jgi:hypothetical protein